LINKGSSSAMANAFRNFMFRVQRTRTWVVIDRVQKRAAPGTMAAIFTCFALKELHYQFSLPGWDLAKSSTKPLSELATEEAKLKGIAYYVNSLKTQQPWEESTLRLLKDMSRYKYWCDEIGEKTNLLSYLVRNWENMENTNESRKLCLKLIYRLSRNSKNIDRLLQELPPPTLAKLLNQSKIDVFGSHVAHTLYSSPQMRASFKELFKPSAVYHTRRVVNAHKDYASILGVAKPQQTTITISTDGLEPLAYMALAWGLRFLWFKKGYQLNSDFSTFTPYAALLSWSYFGYWMSGEFQGWLKQRRKLVVDPTTPGSVDEKRTELRIWDVVRDAQILLFAYLFPFTFVPHILDALKKRHIEGPLTFPVVANTLMVNRW